MSSGSVVQYADDTTLCCSARTHLVLEIETFLQLNSCIQYFAQNNLKANALKTNYIDFSRKLPSSESQLTIMVDDAVIEEVDSFKFLGIHIDRGLSWSFHLDSICSKVSSGTYALRVLSKYCPTNVLKMAYFGLVHSHMSYGIALWGCCADKYFLRLFRLQKRAIRIIGKLQFRESCRDAFRELNVLTLACLYILETVLFCKFKCTLTQGRDVHAYETRGRENFRPEQYRLEAARNLPSNFGVKLLNKLPENIKSETCQPRFKSQLRRFLVEHVFYTVGEFFDYVE